MRFTRFINALQIPTLTALIEQQIHDTERELLEAHIERENALCRAERAHIDILNMRLSRLELSAKIQGATE